MNILITGCNGQLGNEMQLLEKDNSQHVFFNTDVAELDITNQLAIEQFVAENQIDGVVGEAGWFMSAPTMSLTVPSIRRMWKPTHRVRTVSMALPNWQVNWGSRSFASGQ